MERIVVSDNYFEKFDYPFSESLIFISSPLSHAEVKNNTFRDSKLDSVLNLQTKSSDVEGIYIEGLDSYGGSVNGLVQAIISENCSIKDIQIQSSNFQKPVLYLNLIEKFSLEQIMIIDSKMKTSIVILNDVQDFSLSEGEISNVSNLGTSMYFLEYKVINAQYGKDVLFALDDFKMENVDFSFITFDSLLTNPESKKVQMMLSNLEFSKIKHSSADPIIQILDLNYEMLEFHFDTVKAENLSLIQPFYKGLMNAKTFINKLEVSDSSMTIFSLEPYAISEQDSPLYIKLENSKILRNFGRADAIIIAKTNSVMQIHNSLFEDNYNLGRGGVVLADQVGSHFSFTGCQFFRNQAIQGGVAYAQVSSLVSFDSCYFEENFGVFGGVLFLGTDGMSQLKKSKVVRNSAYNGSVVFLINSLLENRWAELELDSNGMIDFQNRFTEEFLKRVQTEPAYQIGESTEHPFVVFKGAAILEEEFMIEGHRNLLQIASNSQLKFEHFKILQADLDEIIQCSSSIITGNNIVLKNINQSFEARQSQYLISVSVNSVFNVEQLQIENLNENLLFADQSQITIKESKVEYCTSQVSSMPYLDLVLGSIWVKGFDFINLQMKGREVFRSFSNTVYLEDVMADQGQQRLFSFSNVNLELKNSEMKNYQFEEDELSLVYIYKSEAKLQDVDFIQIKNGQALKVSDDDLSTSAHQIEIMKSKFKEIEADQGSAIFISNYNAKITSSIFQENYAQDQGGAIFLSCSQIFLPQCNFILSKNNFEKNKSGNNGGAIAFDLQPFKFLEDEEEDSNIYSLNEAGSGYGDNYSGYPFDLKVAKKPEKITSGQPLMEPYFEIYVVDYFGQKITTDRESTILAYSASDNGAITGLPKRKVYMGGVELSDFQVIAQPQSEMTIGFEGSLIDEQKFKLVKAKEYEPQTETYTLDNCHEGEILSDSICETCSKGTYSLDLGATKCLFCPDNFSCPGANVLNVKAGFWRANTDTTEVYPCLEIAACLGGPDSTCAKGYQGPICSECIGEDPENPGDFYARSGKYACQKCEASSKIALKLFGILVLVIAYVSGMVTIIILSANRAQQNSVLVRIMTNYFQIVLMVRNLDIVWPDRVQALLNGISFVSSAQEDMLQLSCLFKGQSFSPYIIGTLGLALLPIVLAILGKIFWYLLSRCFKKIFAKTQQRNSMTTAFVITYLAYPSITNTVFQGFNCTKIENKSYLKSDIEIECYSQKHMTVIFSLIIPIIIIWVVGFPVMTFLVLRSRREQLDERKNVIMFGLFYIGLKDETYYWEVVVNNLRKVVVVAISVSFGQDKAHLQLMLIFSYMYLNHQLIKNFKPYQVAYINQIDLQSSTASISAILLGLMFLRGNSARSTAEMETVFVLLFLVNFAFLARWVRAISMIYIKKVQNKILKDVNATKKIRMAEGYEYDRKNFQYEMRKKEEKKRKRAMEANKKVNELMMLQNTGHVPKKLEHDRLQDILWEMQEEDKQSMDKRRRSIAGSQELNEFQKSFLKQQSQKQGMKPEDSKVSFLNFQSQRSTAKEDQGADGSGAMSAGPSQILLGLNLNPSSSKLPQEKQTMDKFLKQTTNFMMNDSNAEEMAKKIPERKSNYYKKKQQKRAESVIDFEL